MKYRIYYDDGYRLDGTEETEIPQDRRFGVMLVVEEDPDMAWELIHNCDFYVFTDGHWLGIDKSGMLDYIVHFADKLRYVLVGRTVSYIKYRTILEQAQRDLQPPKTAWREAELT